MSEPKKYKLKIYCKQKHDDYTVIVVEVPAYAPRDHIKRIREAGGLDWGNTFTPWHSISYIEVVQS